MLQRSNITAALGLLMFITFFAAHQPALASSPFQDSYPPPSQTTTAPVTGDDAPIFPTVAAYPPAGLGVDTLTPVPIGIQSAGQPPSAVLGTEAGVPAQNAGSRGLIFLWLGFIATFLIFLTSVVGSIVLFTRRNES